MLALQAWRAAHLSSSIRVILEHPPQLKKLNSAYVTFSRVAALVEKTYCGLKHMQISQCPWLFNTQDTSVLLSGGQVPIYLARMSLELTTA